MVYNHELEEYLDQTLTPQEKFTKKKMFGGICYLTNGNMVCGVHKDSIILRMGVENAEQAQQDPYFEDFDITGRKMKGWVMIHQKHMIPDKAIQHWIQKTLEFCESLPPK